MNEIDEATQLQTTASEVAAGLWRIELSTERVAFTIDFRHRGGERYSWADSTLAVDGQRRPLAKDLRHLASIFRDPDQRADFGPMPPDSLPGRAPAVVQHSFHTLRNRLKSAGIVRLGRTDRHWIIEAQAGQSVLRVNFIVIKKYCTLDYERPFQVSVNGVDHSVEAGDNLEQALSLFLGPGPQATPSIGGISAAADTARSNSVEVRRTVVMRN